MRANRRMPLPDLMLAQLERRLKLSEHPIRNYEAEEVLSELIVYWIFLGVVATFCLTIWVLGGE